MEVGGVASAAAASQRRNMMFVEHRIVIAVADVVWEKWDSMTRARASTVEILTPGDEVADPAVVAVGVDVIEEVAFGAEARNADD